MNNLDFDFKDKVALVTGGARGIGFEITKSFLQAGAVVHAWDYDLETLESAKKELSQFSSQLHCQQVDVSQFASCSQAAESLNGLDILVNNAGITRDKSFAKMTPELFQEVINTNLSGVFNTTKACLTRFSESSAQKRIISLSSVVALYGNFGQTNYVAAKAGVIGMTKTWARELGSKGFTANAIAPGFTRTPMVAAMPNKILEQMESKVPVRALGEPRDIANACLFLASEEARYINGATLSVDGGLVI